MRLLLDTHVLLWALSETGRLSPDALSVIADPDNEVVVSAASAWEIAIKQSLGKIELPGPAEVWLPGAVSRTGFDWLPISAEDALRTRALPLHHRDPFDRMLVAQAQGGYTLVSHDERLRPYGVTVLWT